MSARRGDLETALPRRAFGSGSPAIVLLVLLELGCARESLPVAMVPAPPLQAPLPMVWQLPPQLARIPAPVAPYVWPDPLQPLPNLEVPQWAGAAAAPFAATVQRAAIYYQLPPELIWAVIKVESNFREQAVSKAGARGLMQLMPRTAKAIGVRDPLDPEQNILGGAYYLRHLANRYRGDIYFTLAAYNAGPGNVQRHGGIPPFPETLNYIRKVLVYYVNTTPTPL
jgi:soluble lytic murein transglycosylase-like protein